MPHWILVASRTRARPSSCSNRTCGERARRSGQRVVWEPTQLAKRTEMVVRGWATRARPRSGGFLAPFRPVAVVGLAEALPLGVTPFGSTSSSSATTSSSSSSLAVAKRGVVTIRMAVVGHPANPSLGVCRRLGNVVEVLDTLAPLPPGHNFIRDWRYCHGGIANAPAYQLGISAFGYNPGNWPDNRSTRGSASASASSERSGSPVLPPDCRASIAESS